LAESGVRGGFQREMIYLFIWNAFSRQTYGEKGTYGPGTSGRKKRPYAEKGTSGPGTSGPGTYGRKQGPCAEKGTYGPGTYGPGTYGPGTVYSQIAQYYGRETASRGETDAGTSGQVT